MPGVGGTVDAAYAALNLASSDVAKFINGAYLTR